MRPVPRPGLSIVRRDIRTLQAGLEWSGAAAVQDGPGIRAVLAAADGLRDVADVVRCAVGQGVAADEARAAVDALIDSGVLVDDAAVASKVPDRSLWSSWWLLAGPDRDAGSISETRRKTRVAVLGDSRVGDAVRRVLADEQIPLAHGAFDATVLVVAADRELVRATVDETMRRDLPFLCVSLRDLVGIVGPFVVPGRTACLRCVDLSRSELEPCWRTIVASAETTRQPAPAVAPALAAATGAYAAAEVSLWASGYLPVSCDAVVEIPYGLGRVETIGYPPHPDCGCGWAEGRATMSA